MTSRCIRFSVPLRSWDDGDAARRAEGSRGCRARTRTPGPGNLGGGAGFPTGSFAPGGFARGGLGGGGLTVRGTVESVDGDTLTIKMASGQTVEVETGESTTYNTQAPASASDVKPGTTVQVQLADGTAGAGRPGASAAPTGPVGTAGSVTVIP